MASLFVGAVVVAAMCGVAESASAATLTNSQGTLTYVGEGDRVNEVTFDEAVPGTVVVERVGADDDPLPTPSGCVVVAAELQYTCPGVSRLVVHGGGGADYLHAGTPGGLTTAAAAIDGGAGDDEIHGGAVADALAGSAGDDELYGGTGADALSGGPGLDYAGFGGSSAVAVSLDDSANDGAPGENDNVASDIEDVGAAAAVSGGAEIVGSAVGNRLRVTQGAGRIVGGGGSDDLTGGPQADTIDARDGYVDRVKCGAGLDSVVADPLDTISDDCEARDIAVVHGGADDAVPTIAWTAPAAGARVSANRGTLLLATVGDDRGIAAVRFLDDERVVCADAIAPYECAYLPAAGDVGRNTLSAVAVDGHGQTATVPRAVVVGRFSARSLTLSANARDRRWPYSLRATGRLRLPAHAGAAACRGIVTVIVRSGGRVVARGSDRLSRQACRFSERLRVPAGRMTVTARFRGSDSVSPRTSARRTVRTG